MEFDSNKKYIVFLYKRESKKIDDDFLEDQTDVSFEFNPLELVVGKIKMENGKPVFISEDDKYKLHLIDDMDAQNEEFVYAFPFDVTSYTDEDIAEYKIYLKEEENKLFTQSLYQIYTKHSKENGLYTFTYDDEKDIYLLDPEDFDASNAAIYSDLKLKAYKRSNNIKKRLLINAKSFNKDEIEDEEEKEEKKIESIPHKATKCSTDYVYADELYDEIRKYVISQDEQIKRIATIFAKNQRIDNPYMKSNFILCGPTGVGKTEIFRRISDIANVPMIIEDSTEFTAAGYVGRTATDILVNLYNAADGDLNKAENGIAYIDEIDKKAGNSGDMEVAKGAVIQSFLKMIEGHVYPIVVGKKQIYFDTSRVTFAFSGAFSGIEKYVKKKKEKSIGFGGNVEKEEEIPKDVLYNTQTLKDYGLLPEFIGRNRIIAMNQLTQADLEKILRESELSYLKLYKKYLAGLNIEFKYNKAVIEAIAKKAMELKTGARSLQSIAEDAVSEADFYIGSKNADQYRQLVITPKTIENNKKFILR